MATNRACDCISVRKDTISFRYGDRTKNGSLQLRRSEMCLGSCRTWRSVQMRARLEPLTIYCFEKSICSAMRRMGSAQHRGHRNCGNWVGRPPLPCDRPCIRTFARGATNGQGRQRMGIGAPVSDEWPTFAKSSGSGNAHPPLSVRSIKIVRPAPETALS